MIATVRRGWARPAPAGRGRLDKQFPAGAIRGQLGGGIDINFCIVPKICPQPPPA